MYIAKLDDIVNNYKNTYHSSSTQYGGIETFCPLGQILVWEYWNVLPFGALKHFEPKNLKRF